MENNNQNNQQKKNNNKKRHNRHFNKRKPKNNESNVQELEATEVLEDVENESFENDEENLEFLEDMFPEESVEAKPAPVKDENEEQVEVVGVLLCIEVRVLKNIYRKTRIVFFRGELNEDVLDNRQTRERVAHQSIRTGVFDRPLGRELGEILREVRTCDLKQICLDVYG